MTYIVCVKFCDGCQRKLVCTKCLEEALCLFSALAKASGADYDKVVLETCCQ